MGSFTSKNDSNNVTVEDSNVWNSVYLNFTVKYFQDSTKTVVYKTGSKSIAIYNPDSGEIAEVCEKIYDEIDKCKYIKRFTQPSKYIDRPDSYTLKYTIREVYPGGLFDSDSIVVTITPQKMNIDASHQIWRSLLNKYSLDIVYEEMKKNFIGACTMNVRVPRGDSEKIELNVTGKNLDSRIQKYLDRFRIYDSDMCYSYKYNSGDDFELTIGDTGGNSSSKVTFRLLGKENKQLEKYMKVLCEDLKIGVKHFK